MLMTCVKIAAKRRLIETALIVFGALSLLNPALARVEAVSFETPRQEALYAALIDELRCLVCANQSLASSNADLAQDLRRKVAAMITRGLGRDQVIAYMLERYGEYVLYRPRFSAATVLLWVGPLLAALGGLAVIIRLAAGKSGARPQAYSAAQLRQAKSLLDEKRG